MIQETISSDHLAAVEEPVSPALRIGDFIYISQQFGIDESGWLVSDDPAEQLRQIFRNIRILVDEEGLDIQHIIKTTLYITDPASIDAVNEAYAEIFHKPYPARSIIGASFLQHNAKVAADAYLIDTRALEVLCSQNCECTGNTCCTGE